MFRKVEYKATIPPAIDKVIGFPNNSTDFSVSKKISRQNITIPVAIKRITPVIMIVAPPIIKKDNILFHIELKLKLPFTNGKLSPIR